MSERRPLDVALDLLVYAPVGLALSARDVLPALARKGRERVEGQVGSARTVGRFAVAQGQARFGGSAPSAPAPAASPVATPVVQSGPGADALAIPGYDSLSALQVLPRLDGLAPDELEAVRAYEEAHRGRKTVLGRIAQLQS
jgi:hypothetical protein